MNRKSRSRKTTPIKSLSNRATKKGSKRVKFTRAVLSMNKLTCLILKDMFSTSTTMWRQTLSLTMATDSLIRKTTQLSKPVKQMCTISKAQVKAKRNYLETKTIPKRYLILTEALNLRYILVKLDNKSKTSKVSKKCQTKQKKLKANLIHLSSLNLNLPHYLCRLKTIKKVPIESDHKSTLKWPTLLFWCRKFTAKYPETPKVKSPIQNKPK